MNNSFAKKKTSKSNEADLDDTQTLNSHKNLNSTYSDPKDSEIKLKTALKLADLENFGEIETKSNSFEVSDVLDKSLKRSQKNSVTMNLQRNQIEDEKDLKLANESDSNSVEMNPPLKKEGQNEKLSEALKNQDLDMLFLACNCINIADITKMSLNSDWNKLTILSLSYNCIGDEGAIQLSKNTSWLNLELFELVGNNISGLAAAKLAENESWIRLKQLDLAENQLGGVGVSELAKKQIMG